MGKIIDLCMDWEFHKGFTEADLTAGSELFEKICLPHTVQEVPMSYLDEKSYQIHSCYRRKLPIDGSMKGSRIFLDFAGVMTACRVYLNGKEAAFHKGGFTPFSVEITDYIRAEGENQVVVHVDSTERKDTPPFGYVVDYLCFGGIYREVTMRTVPGSYIKDVFAKPEDVLTDCPSLQADVQAECLEEGILTAVLTDGNTVIAEKSVPVQEGRKDIEIRMENLHGIELWEPGHPKLYELQTELRTEHSSDRSLVRIGFRTAEFSADGFRMNGKKMKLLGLNRHQQYPYVGYAMPRRAQQKDADILKYELGINIVRTSHYPQSPAFLDRCDEIGLLVFTEMPGWQYIGDRSWQDQACQDLEDLIIRDRNHPSVILWGVRINESKDNHDFYSRTNAIAHRLDPTRQTGGVRCFTDGEMLEDVYTYNDFAHNGGEVILKDQKEVTGQNRYVPYMVAENNGHMYPTKRFDGEERKIEHALRHIRVLNAASADDHMCGMTAWCAFDYNTHKDFGSGDKICYHGVMDMFRIPKFAAYAYASQSDEYPVLQPATHWTRGDRSEAMITPITVFTNCDCVKLTSGGVDMGMFSPDYDHYPALKHPPVIIECKDNGWGIDMENAIFTGYKSGAAVIEHRYTANPLPKQLVLKADTETLSAGPWDTTRFCCTLADECGNPLYYAFEPVRLYAEGPGKIIGPASVSLIGGQIGFWIRTDGEPGKICVWAESAGLTSKRVYIKVI